MFGLSSIVLQIPGWPIDTTYQNFIVGFGIVGLILVLVYIALYSSQES